MFDPIKVSNTNFSFGFLCLKNILQKSLNGVDIEMLKVLAMTMKFRPNIVPEKSWGAKVNGTWIGTTGSVSLLTS